MNNSQFVNKMGSVRKYGLLSNAHHLLVAYELFSRGDVSSVPYKMVFMYSKKPIIIHSIPSVSSFPYVALETVPVFICLAMALSHPFKEEFSVEHFLFPSLSPVQAINGAMSLAWHPQVDVQH